MGIMCAPDWQPLSKRAAASRADAEGRTRACAAHATNTDLRILYASVCGSAIAATRPEGPSTAAARASAS